MKKSNKSYTNISFDIELSEKNLVTYLMNTFESATEE